MKDIRNLNSPKSHSSTDVASFLLLKVHQKGSYRVIFFSKIVQFQWYKNILNLQGFNDENLSQQYDRFGLLGEGSFGQVIEAQHKYSKKKYAIKLV